MLTHAAQIGELGEHARRSCCSVTTVTEQFQRADGYGIDARVAAVLAGLDSIPTGREPS
jgi:hypothetical protein